MISATEASTMRVKVMGAVRQFTSRKAVWFLSWLEICFYFVLGVGAALYYTFFA